MTLRETSMRARHQNLRAVAPHTPSLYSVHYSGDTQTRLELGTLRKEAENAEKIVMFSAYYSRQFLLKFLELIRKPDRCSIFFVFNGFAGRRLKEQLNDLREIAGRYRDRGFTNFCFYLNLESRLFHTKLYRFESRGLTTWFVGSANASSEASDQNEEILLCLRGTHQSLDAYVKKVIRWSTPLSNVEEPRIDSLVKFFRTGLLYFKQTTQIQFTFPLKLPDLVNDTLSKLETRPRNTEPGEAWGAYNVKLFLGLKAAEEDEKASKAPTKPWAIETCFGYWVPTKYAPDLDNAIDRSAGRKRAKLEEARDKIRRIGQDGLIEDYRRYLNEVQDILDKNKITASVWRPPNELPDKYRAFINRLGNRLDNPEHVRRASRHLDAARMPEIWTDPVAADEFENSFFEYVSFAANSTHIPRVIRSLQQRIGFEGFEGAEAIRERMADDLRRHPWDDGAWL
jgi:hypothetical protein